MSRCVTFDVCFDNVGGHSLPDWNSLQRHNFDLPMCYTLFIALSFALASDSPIASDSTSPIASPTSYPSAGFPSVSPTALVSKSPTASPTAPLSSASPTFSPTSALGNHFDVGWRLTCPLRCSVQLVLLGLCTILPQSDPPNSKRPFTQHCRLPCVNCFCDSLRDSVIAISVVCKQQLFQCIEHALPLARSLSSDVSLCR